MEKEVRNLVISTPLLRPEAHQLRISLKPSPILDRGCQVQSWTSLPKSEGPPFPVHSDFHR